VSRKWVPVWRAGVCKWTPSSVVKWVRPSMRETLQFARAWRNTKSGVHLSVHAAAWRVRDDVVSRAGVARNGTHLQHSVRTFNRGDSNMQLSLIDERKSSALAQQREQSSLRQTDRACQFIDKKRGGGMVDPEKPFLSSTLITM